jgi:hypothetical protein
MSIADEIASEIMQKHGEIAIKENREAEFEVYMDVKIWGEMMAELHTTKGGMSSASWSVRHTNGEKIMGYNIYRCVPVKDKHIRIFEVD